MSAFADWISSVPWVMCTLPDRMHGRDSSTEQSELAAETCICWLRSEDFAQAPPAALHASAARSGNVLAAGWFIAAGDLGEALDASGCQVGPHSGAPLCVGGGVVYLWVGVGGGSTSDTGGHSCQGGEERQCASGGAGDGTW